MTADDRDVRDGMAADGRDVGAAVATRWPHVRAALIALAIAFALIDGLPLPPPADTPAWERGFVDDVRAVQRVALWPVAWMHPRLRIAQRWALYQAPSDHVWRVWLEARLPDGRWNVVYRTDGADDDGYGAILEHGRVRGPLDIRDTPPEQYALLADWITARVLADMPHVTAARLRMERVQLDTDGAHPSGQFAFVHVRERGVP
ncbi:MAG: hypothetical protein JO257_22315 [Deltaproteobacteria bacterium]|nr:hypothetical protein [Deltaproteobacteria bacterium]